MITIEIGANWLLADASIWYIEPDDPDWYFFHAHCNVGDTVTISSVHRETTCTYKVLNKERIEPDEQA